MRALVVIGAFLALVAPAAGRSHPRPDLVVKAGTVTAANGRLTGTFVVRNAGRRRARASTAALLADRVVLARFGVRSIRRAHARRKTVDVAVPSMLAAGTHALRACADRRGTVRERSEANNCRRVGTLVIAAPPAPTPTSTSTPTPTVTVAPTSTPPPSSVPADPVPYTKDEVLDPGNGRTYWTYVPAAYDASHQTPTPLLVWLHGCGGNSSGDIYTVSPGGAQTYIAITVDGRETGVNGSDGCWDPAADQQKVLDAVANVKTHFNVDPHHVVIGGYSSGGDLAYRTAFYHALTFAGLLAENTSPFKDTGSTQQSSIAAAAWKFNVVHLAHAQDDVYPIDTVKSEVKALQDAGFPATLITRDGAHGDGTTDPDLRALLLPHMDDDWRSP